MFLFVLFLKVSSHFEKEGIDFIYVVDGLVIGIKVEVLLQEDVLFYCFFSPVKNNFYNPKDLSLAVSCLSRLLHLTRKMFA